MFLSARCRPIHCTIIGHKASYQNSTKPYAKPCATCTKTKRKDEKNIRPLGCQIFVGKIAERCSAQSHRAQHCTFSPRGPSNDVLSSDWLTSLIKGQELYAKLCTKPIFNQRQLLTAHNLNRLRTITELKYRLQIAIYSLIICSARKDNQFIPLNRPKILFTNHPSSGINFYVSSDNAATLIRIE